MDPHSAPPTSEGTAALTRLLISLATAGYALFFGCGGCGLKAPLYLLVKPEMTRPEAALMIATGAAYLAGAVPAFGGIRGKPWFRHALGAWAVTVLALEATTCARLAFAQPDEAARLVFEAVLYAVLPASCLVAIADGSIE